MTLPYDPAPLTVAEAYEAWSVCFEQTKVARTAVDTWSTLAMRFIRIGEQRHPAIGWAFEAQDDLEHAEAALSTARELWDVAKAAEPVRLGGAK